jgi:hypothetical protein
VDLKRFRFWSPITRTISENRHLLRTSGGIAALIITAGVLLWTLFAALRPLPKRDVSIATGPPGSAYVQVAERYREVLARNGVRLHLVPTDGAVANLERLRDSRNGVDAGFVQAGTTSERESPNLVSLGTVFYEPALALLPLRNTAATASPARVVVASKNAQLTVRLAWLTVAAPHSVAVPLALNRQPKVPAFLAAHWPVLRFTTYQPEPTGLCAEFPLA